MYSLNKAQLIGNLTRDPEVKQTTSGKMVAQVGVATNMQWKDKDSNKQEKVEFHNVVLWGALAEIAEKYLKKGSKVYVEGRIETRSWETDTGEKRYKTEIVGEEVIMLSSKETEPRGDSADAPAKPERKPRAPLASDEIKVEDIPFS